MGLVLQRKIGEWVDIGKEISVRCVSIRGDTIKIDVNAPRGMRVDRREIRERIAAKQEGPGDE